VSILDEDIPWKDPPALLRWTFENRRRASSLALGCLLEHYGFEERSTVPNSGQIWAHRGRLKDTVLAGLRIVLYDREVAGAHRSMQVMGVIANAERRRRELGWETLDGIRATVEAASDQRSDGSA
jgi:hypothetical protein